MREFTYHGIVDAKTTSWPTINLTATSNRPYRTWSFQKALGSFTDTRNGDCICVFVLCDTGVANYNAYPSYDSRYVCISTMFHTAVIVDAMFAPEYTALYPNTSAAGNDPHGAGHWMDGAYVYFFVSQFGAAPLHNEGAFRNWLFKFSLADLDFSTTHYVQITPNYCPLFMGASATSLTSDDVPYPVYRGDTGYLTDPQWAEPNNFPDIFSQLSYLDDGVLTPPYYDANYGLYPFSVRGERQGLIGPGNFVFDFLGGGVVQDVMKIYATFKGAWTTFLGGQDQGPPWYTYCQLLTSIGAMGEYWYITPPPMDFSVDQSVNYIYTYSPYRVASPRSMLTQMVTPYPIVNANYCVISNFSDTGYVFASVPEYFDSGTGSGSITQMHCSYNGADYYSDVYNAADASNGYVYVSGHMTTTAGGSTPAHFPGTTDYYIYQYDMMRQEIRALPMHTAFPKPAGYDLSGFIVTKNNTMLMYKYSSDVFGLTPNVQVTEMVLPATLNLPIGVTNPVYAADIRSFY